MPDSSQQKTPTARLNDLGTRLALLDQAAGVSMTTGRVQFGAAWDIAVEALVEARALVEQFEALKQTAQEIESMAFRQYVDWMHFHELAMAKPFEAESEVQDFARRVSSLLTIALGADSTIEVLK